MIEKVKNKFMAPLPGIEITSLHCFGDRNNSFQGRRASPTVQFKAQTFSREVEIKVEWSLHSHCSHTFWSGYFEDIV